MQDLTVTLVQTDLVWEDIDANLSNLNQKIAALETPTDLIILPEMFSTGFSMAADRLAESMQGKAVSWLAATAAARRATITGSLMIRESGHFYNRLIWARPDGEIDHYDKKHLFRYAGEEKIYTPGEDHKLFRIKQWRIRPFICYDLRFPIWTRNTALVYDLAIFVASWPAKRAAHWQTLLKARAIENQACVIGVNRVGADGLGIVYNGCSTALSAQGEVLFEAVSRESTHSLTLDHSALERYRIEFPAWKDADQV